LSKLIPFRQSTYNGELKKLNIKIISGNTRSGAYLGDEGVRPDVSRHHQGQGQGRHDHLLPGGGTNNNNDNDDNDDDDNVHQQRSK
jgi:hypothetical protein